MSRIEDGDRTRNLNHPSLTSPYLFVPYDVVSTNLSQQDMSPRNYYGHTSCSDISRNKTRSVSNENDIERRSNSYFHKYPMKENTPMVKFYDAERRLYRRYFCSICEIRTNISDIRASFKNGSSSRMNDSKSYDDAIRHIVLSHPKVNDILSHIQMRDKCSSVNRDDALLLGVAFNRKLSVKRTKSEESAAAFNNRRTNDLNYPFAASAHEAKIKNRSNPGRTQPFSVIKSNKLNYSGERLFETSYDDNRIDDDKETALSDEEEKRSMLLDNIPPETHLPYSSPNKSLIFPPFWWPQGNGITEISPHWTATPAGYTLQNHPNLAGNCLLPLLHFTQKYMCSYCRNTYSSRGNVNRHIRNSHRDKINEVDGIDVGTYSGDDNDDHIKNNQITSGINCNPLKAVVENKDSGLTPRKRKHRMPSELSVPIIAGPTFLNTGKGPFSNISSSRGSSYGSQSSSTEEAEYNTRNSLSQITKGLNSYRSLERSHVGSASITHGVSRPHYERTGCMDNVNEAFPRLPSSPTPKIISAADLPNIPLTQLVIFHRHMRNLSRSFMPKGDNC